MKDDLGAFPVPQIILDRIDRKHLRAFEQDSSSSDSEVDSISKTVLQTPAIRRRLESISAFREHLSHKGTFSVTNLSSENLEGLIAEYIKRASPKSRRKYFFSCVAGTDDPFLLEIEMPRRNLNMSSQVDMFAQSPPCSDEDRMKGDEKMPASKSAAGSKIEDTPRRSSRIKNQVVSSSSEFKAPLDSKVNPKLKTTKKEEQTDKSASYNPKPSASSTHQRKDGKKIQTPSCILSDSDDDGFQLRIDVSPRVRSLDAVIPESENSLPIVKTNSLLIEKDEFENKSPKNGTKESKAVSPGKSMLENATETHVSSSLSRSSEPAEGRSDRTARASNREKKGVEVNPHGAPYSLNGNSPNHSAGGDDAQDRASAEVAVNTPDSNPSQHKRQSYDQSSVQDVGIFSPNKTPQKDNFTKKSPQKSASPKKPAKQIRPDSSDSESGSNKPDDPKTAKPGKPSFSPNQLSTNGGRILVEKDDAKSNDTVSSESRTELSTREKRDPENVSDKSGTVKKEGNNGSHSDSSDSDELHFDNPTATSTQKIALPNRKKSSESESDSSEVEQSINRRKKQDSILPSKSGAATSSKRHTDGNDAESESSDSEDGNATNARRLSPTLAKTRFEKKERGSRSGSESSNSDKATGSGKGLLSGTTTISNHGGRAVEKEESSNTGSSQSEDEYKSKGRQSNITATKSQQIASAPKPGTISINNSGSESDESNRGKNGEAEKTDPRTSAIAMKAKNNGSSSDSDSSQSAGEKTVNPRHSPGIAAQTPLKKNVSRQSEDSDSGSDSSKLENEKTVKAQLSPVVISQAPLKITVSGQSEDSDSESDSSQKKTVKALHSPAIAPQAPLKKDVSSQSEEGDSESDSSQPKTVNAKHSPAITSQAPLKTDVSSQSEEGDSESDSSQPKTENAKHSPAIAPQPPIVKNAPKQSDDSDSESDSHRLEGKKTVTTPQKSVPKKGISSSSSGSDSDKPNSSINSKQASNADSVKVANNGSSGDSHSSQSKHVKTVKAQNSPAIAAHTPLIENPSKQSGNIDSESDSSRSSTEKTSKTQHSSVSAPQSKSAPKNSESSDTESDSSDSEEENIPNIPLQAGLAQNYGKYVAVEADMKQKSSSDSDSDDSTKVGAAPVQTPKNFSKSRISEKSSSESDSSDSEKEQKKNLSTTKVERKNCGSGDESRKQPVKRSNDEQNNSSDSDSSSSGPDQSPGHSKIRVKPIEILKTSIVDRTDDTATQKRPQASHKSSSSDDTPVQNDERITKQSVVLLDATTPLKRKASEILSPQSNSLQPKAKLQKLSSPHNHPGESKAASENHSSSSSSEDSDNGQTETRKNAEPPRGVGEGQKRGKTAEDKSVADQSAHAAEMSVSRKRKADSVSSTDSSDPEPKKKQRKVETPVTPVAQQSHPVNSTVCAGDTQPVFPGGDISFIPKPGSTPSSKVNPSKPTSQRSILEFAKPLAPVSSTPELPQKKVRNNQLDLLKCEYLNTGYQDVGDQIDFDSHSGLFEEDLLKNDVKVYVVQCPKEVDPESLVGRKIYLSQKETQIELTDKSGSKTAYEVYCDLGDTDVGVSLITPSKRRKKFTLTSVPVVGRVTIAETLHVPAVQEVASSSPPRVPFPENLKPRNPFVDSDDSAAEEILKNIKQKHSKRKHEYSTASNSLPDVPSAVSGGKKHKEKVERTTELISTERDNELKPSTAFETAPRVESLDATSDDTKKIKKKKRKMDKSSVDSPAILEVESTQKDGLSSNPTNNLGNKPLAGGPSAVSHEKKHKEKVQLTAELISTERDNVLKPSTAFETAPCVESLDATSDDTKKMKKKKRRKDKSSVDTPAILEVESTQKDGLSSNPTNNLGHKPLAGKPDSIPDEKKKKKQRKKDKEHPKEELLNIKIEQPSQDFSHKEPLRTTESDINSSKKKKKKMKKEHGELDLLENRHVPAEISCDGKERELTSDHRNQDSSQSNAAAAELNIKKKKKKKKEKEHEKKDLTEKVGVTYYEHSSKESCLQTQIPIASGESDVTSVKKKKKKRKREKEFVKVELTSIEQLPRQDLLHKEPVPAGESDPISDYKIKKKRKKDEEHRKEEHTKVKTEHEHPSLDIPHKEPLPTTDSELNSSKKKKKKNKRERELDLQGPTEAPCDEKDGARTSDPRYEDTSGPTIAKKKKKKRRDQL